MDYTIHVRENEEVPVPVEDWLEQIGQNYSKEKFDHAMTLLNVIATTPLARDEAQDLIGMKRSSIYDMLFNNVPNLFNLGLILVVEPERVERGRPTKYFILNNKGTRPNCIDVIKHQLLTKKKARNNKRN